MEHMRQRVSAAIVVLMIMMTCGFLVGAVGKARVNEKYVKCLQHIHELCLVMGTYYDYQSRFPMATEPVKTLPVERRWSWVFTLMPFYEKIPEWKDCDILAPWDDPKHKRFVESPLPRVSCPLQLPGQSGGGLSRANYVGIAGLGPDAPFLPVTSSRAGVFAHERRTRVRDIQDGLSCTLLFAETSWKPGPWAAGGQSTIRYCDVKDSPYIGVGRQFGGLHRRGAAVVARADLSYHYMHEGTTPEVWEKMATIAGKEQQEFLGNYQQPIEEVIFDN